MATSDRMKAILQLTNYFDGHWEDPEWWQRMENQAVLYAVINGLAEAITDEPIRKEIFASTAAGMVAAAHRMIETPRKATENVRLHSRAR